MDDITDVITKDIMTKMTIIRTTAMNGLKRGMTTEVMLEN